MYGIHNLCPREHKIVRGWIPFPARASLPPLPHAPSCQRPVHIVPSACLVKQLQLLLLGRWRLWPWTATSLALAASESGGK